MAERAAERRLDARHEIEVVLGRHPDRASREARAAELAVDPLLEVVAATVLEQQQLLRDSIERFVQDEYAFDARRKIVASEAGASGASATAPRALYRTVGSVMQSVSCCGIYH